MISDIDVQHLRRCIDLAEHALRDGLHVGRALSDVCGRARWIGLGRIVYASSSEQLSAWLAEIGIPQSPVRPLPIQAVVPGIVRR